MSARIRPIICLMLLACCVGIAAAQDKPVDIEALKARSDQGDNRATRELAERYYVGRGGVEQDYGEARRFYERLAKRGDPRAQTTLGTIYARGYGVDQNFEVARYWWTQAAKKNDAGAFYDLGTLYHRGEGVTQDYVQAAEWYRKAAHSGHVIAQKNLARMHWERQGVERSAQWAYYWFKIAALLGDDESQEALPIVARTMTQSQIRQAESEAADWMRKYKKIVGD
jgi:TPR repeat protein